MSKKEIGQYFSGTLVSDLLVEACELDDIGSIMAIDPMVGQADMLSALIRAGASEQNLYGIDIDEEAIAVAEDNASGTNLLVGDAFSIEATATYMTHAWDLVITNPPYVRYQGLGEMYGDDAVNSVRNSLLGVLGRLDNNGTKALYIEGASNYSGLSDLAVPSWILCAYLVKPGGKLAMVLPDSWIKREYADVICSILRRDFTIERIIDDDSRTWFADAQIKTCLLVARKTCDGNHPRENRFRRIGLNRRASTRASLVGNLQFESTRGVDAFRAICNLPGEYTDTGVWARDESTAPFYESLGGGFESGANLSNLEKWGVHVGQGLRTGANDFFYLHLNDDGTVSNYIWINETGNPCVPKDELPLLPALRRQSDLGNSYVIDAKSLRELVLYIQTPLKGREGWLNRYIGYCESCDIVRRGRKQRIPTLSAVRTNGPTSDVVGSSRYWYMLPQLKARHMPDLVTPRVNGDKIKTYLMPQNERILADANFSTFCLDKRVAVDAYAILALLNSTYVCLQLERICNVLGGGALKCEAVSLRKLCLPLPTECLVSELQRLGQELVRGVPSSEREALHAIDVTIARELVGCDEADKLADSWLREHDMRLATRRA